MPLDPTHPEERLHYIMDDAAVSCVITKSSFLPIFDGAGAPTLLLDEESDALARQPDTCVDADVQPEDLAYVIYTSGSTGRPKGVRSNTATSSLPRGNAAASPALPRATLLAVTTCPLTSPAWRYGCRCASAHVWSSPRALTCSTGTS